MPQPTLGDVHVNRPLTMLSVGYQQEASDFIADKVFPGVSVPNKSDLYFKYNLGDFFRNAMQKRAPGTEAAGGGYKVSTGTYTAEVWALRKDIDDQIRANTDSPLNADRDAVLWLTQQALLNRDVAFGSSYFKIGVWGTDLTGVASGTPTSAQFLQWDESGSTPIDDILAAQLKIKETTGMWPNTLTLGAQVFMKLLTNAQILDRLKYGQTAPGPVVVKTTDLAQLFQIKRVLVSSGVLATSAETNEADEDVSPTTTAFIHGKDALLSYAADAPGIMQPSAGYTFNWTGFTGATAGGTRIKKYRWESTASDRVEIDSAYAMAVVAKNLGFFFSGCIA